jgi:hypothetical protein
MEPFVWFFRRPTYELVLGLNGNLPMYVGTLFRNHLSNKVPFICFNPILALDLYMLLTLSKHIVRRVFAVAASSQVHIQ